MAEVQFNVGGFVIPTSNETGLDIGRAYPVEYVRGDGVATVVHGEFRYCASPKQIGDEIEYLEVGYTVSATDDGMDITSGTDYKVTYVDPVYFEVVDDEGDDQSFDIEELFGEYQNFEIVYPQTTSQPLVEKFTTIGAGTELVVITDGRGNGHVFSPGDVVKTLERWDDVDSRVCVERIRDNICQWLDSGDVALKHDYTPSKFKIGDRVRMISENPSRGFGAVSTGDVGVVTHVDGVKLIVDFPVQPGWTGIATEFELEEATSELIGKRATILHGFGAGISGTIVDVARQNGWLIKPDSEFEHMVQRTDGYVWAGRDDVAIVADAPKRDDLKVDMSEWRPHIMAGDTVKITAGKFADRTGTFAGVTREGELLITADDGTDQTMKADAEYVRLVTIDDDVEIEYKLDVMPGTLIRALYEDSDEGITEGATYHVISRYTDDTFTIDNDHSERKVIVVSAAKTFEIVALPTIFEPGDIVRMVSEKPVHGSAGVQTGDIGIVRKIDNGKPIVFFEAHHNWQGIPPEFEKITDVKTMRPIIAMFDCKK